MFFTFGCQSTLKDSFTDGFEYENQCINKNKSERHCLNSFDSFSPKISQNDLKSYLSFLSSADMRGRMTGSPEEKVYTHFLARHFKSMGLTGLKTKENFFQSFEFISSVELGENNQLQTQIKNSKKNWILKKDWIPVSFSHSGIFSTEDIVFAGYGIKAPAESNQKEYNSYKNLDVKNKWVLIFRFIPEKLNEKRKQQLNLYAKLQHKATLAKNLGAKGVLIMSGPNSHARSQLEKLQFEGSATTLSLPVISISDQLGQTLLGISSKKLKIIQTQIDQNETFKPRHLKISLNTQINLKHKKETARNVLASLTVNPDAQTLIIGAHGDHLGTGLTGTSLSTEDDLKLTSIHFGADDNASGVSALMEIAHKLTHAYKTKIFTPQYNVLFAIWTGEELGLLGSQHFTQEFNGLKKIAYLNMDMIGRLDQSLIIQGVQSSPEWNSVLKTISTDLHTTIHNDPFIPSDALSFYLADVPTLNFFTGTHDQYHTTRDTIETIHFGGLEKTTQFIYQLIFKILNEKTSLTHQKVEGVSPAATTRSGQRQFRVYLGTIPHYSGNQNLQNKGVTLSGVKPGSPASKIGLTKGDRIIKLADKDIENIYDYVYCLKTLTPKQKVKITIVRDDQTLTFDLIPDSRL